MALARDDAADDDVAERRREALEALDLGGREREVVADLLGGQTGEVDVAGEPAGAVAEIAAVLALELAPVGHRLRVGAPRIDPEQARGACGHHDVRPAHARDQRGSEPGQRCEPSGIGGRDRLDPESEALERAQQFRAAVPPAREALARRREAERAPEPEGRCPQAARRHEDERSRRGEPVEVGDREQQQPAIRQRPVAELQCPTIPGRPFERAGRDRKGERAGRQQLLIQHLAHLHREPAGDEGAPPRLRLAEDERARPRCDGDALDPGAETRQRSGRQG